MYKISVSFKSGLIEYFDNLTQDEAVSFVSGLLKGRDINEVRVVPNVKIQKRGESPNGKGQAGTPKDLS